MEPWFRAALGANAEVPHGPVTGSFTRPVPGSALWRFAFAIPERWARFLNPCRVKLLLACSKHKVAQSSHLRTPVLKFSHGTVLKRKSEAVATPTSAC